MRASTRRSALPLAFALAALLLTAALPAAAATYEIDGTHSSAIFKAKHLGASNFYGRFNDVSGTIHYDPAKPEASKIKVAIKSESVATGNERRDGHIKSPDFLNAAQFPEITFESTSVKKISDDKLEVTGKLTLHGVSKEITVTAEKTGEGKQPQSGTELIGFETHFSVERTAYDMGFMVGPLGDEIGFILALEAGKK